MVSPEYETEGVGRWDGYQEVRLDALNLRVQIVAVMKLRTEGNSSPEQLPWRWSKVADGHVDLKHTKMHNRVRDVRTTERERLE